VVCVITGSIYIALPEVEDWLTQSSADRRALLMLEACPDGARAVVDIGDRQLYDVSLVAYLHEQGGRLHLDIRGTDSRAVADLVRAARNGSWDVVA
jgi:hypothetical protein